MNMTLRGTWEMGVDSFKVLTPLCFYLMLFSLLFFCVFSPLFAAITAALRYDCCHLTPCRSYHLVLLFTAFAATWSNVNRME